MKFSPLVGHSDLLIDDKSTRKGRKGRIWKYPNQSIKKRVGWSQLPPLKKTEEKIKKFFKDEKNRLKVETS